MCGITGYIGASKNPYASHQLLTSLFNETEIRGTDASGVWGCTSDDRIIYHKEPIKSSEFIKKDFWKQIGKLNPNLILAHARGASPNSGLPSENKNNHPFVSMDKTIGLVHNGRVLEYEYSELKQRYKTFSQCDSEILLRIFENPNIAEESNDKTQIFDKRLQGIRDIWSQVDRSHMAVVIGEKLENNARRLWLFRNVHRTLWLIDLRPQLGQIFFCSTEEIWKAAVANCPAIAPYVKRKVMMIRLPTEEVWILNTDNDHPIVEDGLLERYEISTDGWKDWEVHDQKDFNEGCDNPPEVLTKLDDEENVLSDDKPKFKVKHYTHQQNHQQNHQTKPANPKDYKLVLKDDTDDSDDTKVLEEDYLAQMHGVGDIDLFKNDIRPLNEAVKSIRDLVYDIETTIENAMMEGSIASNNYNEIVTGLEQIALELTATLTILNSESS